MVRYGGEFKRTSITHKEAAELRAEGKKRCPRCERIRPFDQFSRDRGRPDGCAPYCRKCLYKTKKASMERCVGLEDLDIRDRLDALIDRATDGCSGWKGRFDGYGYAQITYRGKNAHAIRVAYILANGELSPRRFLRSSCGNRACMSLDHWSPGRNANAPKLNTRRGKSLRARRDRRLLGEVEAAIPASLPPEVREEMRQELVLAALSGRRTQYAKVTPQKTKTALSLAWSKAVGDFGALSIDVPVSDDEDSETYRDVLPDTSIFADPALLVDVARRFDASADLRAWCDSWWEA